MTVLKGMRLAALVAVGLAAAGCVHGGRGAPPVSDRGAAGGGDTGGLGSSSAAGARGGVLDSGSGDPTPGT